MSKPIDFEKEALQLHHDLRLQGFDQDKLFILDAIRSIAARVERETIERCQEYVQHNWRPVTELPHLYSPAPSDAAKDLK